MATTTRHPVPAPPAGGEQLRPQSEELTFTNVAGVQAQSDQLRESSTGARNVVRTLEELGVKNVFGMPGGAILPVYDELFASTRLRHILVRHEQGAGHAASGYAHATGRVGVCVATSGPGATNLVTAIADANMDSIPMVAITGQVAEQFIGSDAFQEADIVGTTLPMTKHSYLVTDPAEIPQRIAEAVHLAGTGRPGPVVVDIAKSAQAEEADFVWPPRIDLPGYRPVTRPHTRQVREAARLITKARRPIILAGGGVIRSNSAEYLRELVDLSGVAVTTTLMGRGALPDSHPNNLGMPGMHGTVAAVAGLQKSDLLIALGARFDDRVTGRLDAFAPHAQIIHADIDPAEISKNRTADIPIVGDLAKTLPALIEALRDVQDNEADEVERADLDPWWGQLNSLRERYTLGWAPTEDGLLAPQHIISRLGEMAPEAIFTAGVGQHQMWAAQFIGYEEPRRWINSGGLGTMGYGLPAAMGAKVGMPDKAVWAIDGDGCFQMTNQELATCALENIPIKVAIINNSSLGMVRQWQTLFYDGRYSSTDLHTSHQVRIPDFVQLGQAYGCHTIRVERADEIDAAIEEAMEVNDRPVVVDFVVSRDAMVWPMVAAGVANDDIQYARGIAPRFEDEE